MMKSRTMLLACALGLAVGSAHAFNLDLNKLGGMLNKAQQANREISEPEEVKIGEGMAATLVGAAPLLKNDKVQRYVNQVGRWLTLNAERPDLPWRFGVLDTGSVNAFAAPGGYIFITRGLYERLQSEADLAGVLSHEIAHVLKKHHLKAIQKTAQAGMMADFLSMAAQQSENGAILEKVISAGTELYARGLDKSDEYEADRMGIVIAARAGYDPFALPGVLHELEKISPNDSGFALLFKTHPAPADRLKAIDDSAGNRLDPYGGQPTLANRFGKFTLK